MHSLPESEKTSTAGSKASWANVFLIPIKQHAFCCGVLPPLINAAFGANAGDILHTIPGKLAVGLITTPLVTYATMALEQAWHDRRHKKDTCRHKTLTLNNFIKQTAIGYGIYAAMAFVLSHDHDHHDHDGHDHQHAGYAAPHEHVRRDYSKAASFSSLKL